jgi:Bacterial Ig-like domain (group 2)
MLSPKRKWLLLSAFLCLIGLAGVGCRGFFVNPTLTSITISPASPNLQVGGTLQLTATGNNDDGSTKNVTSSATWSSSDATRVTVSSTGLVKGIANSSTTGVTITATSGTVSGTDTVTVGQTQQTLSIASSPSSPISLATLGGSTTITFSATLNGTDVTSSTSFSSNNPSVISQPSSNIATIVGGVGSATITGTDNNNHTGSITIQVTQ